MSLLQFFVKLFVRLSKHSLGYLDWNPYVPQVLYVTDLKLWHTIYVAVLMHIIIAVTEVLSLLLMQLSIRAMSFLAIKMIKKVV